MRGHALGPAGHFGTVFSGSCGLLGASRPSCCHPASRGHPDRNVPSYCLLLGGSQCPDHGALSLAVTHPQHPPSLQLPRGLRAVPGRCWDPQTPLDVGLGSSWGGPDGAGGTGQTRGCLQTQPLCDSLKVPKCNHRPDLPHPITKPCPLAPQKKIHVGHFSQICTPREISLPAECGTVSPEPTCSPSPAPTDFWGRFVQRRGLEAFLELWDTVGNAPSHANPSKLLVAP